MNTAASQVHLQAASRKSSSGKKSDVRAGTSTQNRLLLLKYQEIGTVFLLRIITRAFIGDITRKHIYPRAVEVRRLRIRLRLVSSVKTTYMAQHHNKVAGCLMDFQQTYPMMRPWSMVGNCEHVYKMYSSSMVSPRFKKHSWTKAQHLHIFSPNERYHELR